MAFIEQMVLWTEKTFGPLGWFGLFILSFMEASFFPIPPDVLLVILTLEAPSLWWVFAIIATVGSVLGALLGYGIGYAGEELVVKRIFDAKKIEKTRKMFQKYEEWAVFIGAFTPIPYKIFTIAAGLFRLNIPKMLVAAFIGRALRFFLVAGLVAYLGQWAVTFTDKYFGWVTLGVAVVAFVVWWIWRKRKR
ncbi:MAG: YqaA family protein [Candidatus Woesearchaeota archaeon]